MQRVRVFDGSIKAGDQLLMMQDSMPFLVEEVGARDLLRWLLTSFSVEVRMAMVTGLKDPEEAVRVGDTLTKQKSLCRTTAGTARPKPMVFTGLSP